MEYYYKSLGRSGGRRQIRDVLVNDVVCHEESEIADGFNMYFTNVAGNLADYIPLSATSPLSFLTPPLQNSLFKNSWMKLLMLLMI